MIKNPNKFFEFGIAEQDMVSFGSGLAAGGFLPIFIVFRAFYLPELKSKYLIFVQKIVKEFCWCFKWLNTIGSRPFSSND